MPRTELQNNILALLEAERRDAPPKPGEDPAYLAWIRTLPCLVCSISIYGLPWIFSPEADLIFETAPIARIRIAEAAHVGSRGLGRKSDDRETIPLCPGHHRTGRDAHHVLGKWFWAYHDLDRERIIGELQARFVASSESPGRISV